MAKNNGNTPSTQEPKDELLETYLIREFNELDKLPIKDKRRIILFAFIASETATLLSVALTAAFSNFGQLSATQNLSALEDDQRVKEIMKRVFQLSEKKEKPTLRELRSIHQNKQLYLLFENLPERLPDNFLE